MKKFRRKKGNVIIVVLCVIFAIALTASASALIVARYSAIIHSRYEKLQEDVCVEKENGETEGEFGGGTS